MPVKTNLPASIIRVLGNIAPGEILLFESSTGLEYNTIRVISELIQLKEEDLCLEKEFPIIVHHTKESWLVKHIFVRRKEDTGETYPIYISTIDDLYSLPRERFREKVSSLLWGAQEAEKIWITAYNNTTEDSIDICDGCPYMSESDSSLSLISAKIPQTKEEMLAKLTELFEEAAYKGYDMAEIVNTLKKKYTENAAINYNEYGLRLDYEYTTADKTHLKRCDIYVKENDTPLQLSAIEKSTYLTYILFADGVKNVLSINFMKTLVDIYSMMADSSMKDFGGIASSKFYNAQTGRYDYNSVQSGTIIGYRNAIKDEINKHIKIKRIAQDFRIEGIKNKPFKVEKSTQELREQIRQIFHLK